MSTKLNKKHLDHNVTCKNLDTLKELLFLNTVLFTPSHSVTYIQRYSSLRKRGENQTNVNPITHQVLHPSSAGLVCPMEYVTPSKRQLGGPIEMKISIMTQNSSTNFKDNTCKTCMCLHYLLWSSNLKR